MGFTIGRVNGKSEFVAACDFCPDVTPATRDAAGECQVPTGWARIGERQQIGDIYGIPVYRSALACPHCQANLQAWAGDGQEDAGRPPLGRGTLVADARAISSGTLATLTGFRTYREIETVQNLFVQWCTGLPTPRLMHFLTWQEAWSYFWEDVACDNPIVSSDDPTWIDRLPAGYKFHRVEEATA